MSISHRTKIPLLGMETGESAEARAGLLAGFARVERLELEERDAVRRGDWVRARRRALERIEARDELHCRAAARRRGR